MRWAGEAMGQNLSQFMKHQPRYDELSDFNMKNRSKEEQNALLREADVHTAGFKAQEMIAQANVAAAKTEADATVGAAQSQAQGISGLASGIAGGIGNIKTSGFNTPSTPQFGTGFSMSGASGFRSAPVLDFSGGSYGGKQYGNTGIF